MASTRAAATNEERAAFGNRLGALTTVFTPPCPTTWLLTTPKVPSQYPPFPTAGPVSCDPPSWYDNISQKGFAFYSPAICPSGFSLGCAVENDRTGEGFPPVTSGETAMYCIPSGYTCTSDTTDFRGGIWGFSTHTIGAGRTATVGPAIQVRWRQADLSILETDPMDPGERPTPSPTNRVNSPATPTSETGTLSVPPVLTLAPSRSEQGEDEDKSIIIATAPSESASAPSTLTEMPSILPEIPTSETPVAPSETQVSLSIPVTSKLTSSSLDTASTARTDTTPILSTPSTPIQSGGSPNQSADGANAPTTASSTSMAAMALSGILIVMILGYLAVASIRRYRLYRLGEVKTFLPFPLPLKPRPNRVGERAGWKWRWNNVLPSRRVVGGRQSKARNADAELGTDGPLPELGPGDPLGTKENPAELAASVASSVRNSWMSHVSRIFAPRSKKDVGSV